MDKQEEIRFLVHTHNIKLGWLAEKLDIKLQLLTYLLHDSPKIDEDLYEKIKEIISSYQFELDLFEKELPEPLDLFSAEKLRLGIGERIRVFAKRKYGTLKKLADAMEISPQQLQQYISGKREPGAKILIKILRLGCDINWLLGGNERIESYRIYKLENELKKLQSSVSQISSVIHKLETPR